MTFSCTTGADDSSKAADSLKSFYQSYIREVSKMPVDEGKLAALQKEHCSAGFLDKLAKASLDADPFLNAQDFEEQWADNLEVTKDGSSGSSFQVCYTASFDNSKHCVKVAMVKEGEKWMIDNVTP